MNQCSADIGGVDIIREATMNSPHRCKCGDFSALPVCPKCRAKRAREDKTVRFLIGDVLCNETIRRNDEE